MKKFQLSVLLFLFAYHLTAQAPPATTAAGYYFATGTNYGLVNMAGGTQVIGPNLENVSTITFELGFNFNFAGTSYTRFSIGSSGIFGLGNTPVSPIYYEPRNSILAPYYVFPLFSPWSDELTTAANGGVSYKLVTNNNIKKLVIEWRLKASSDDATNNYNKTFQAWIVEGSNRIQYVYGNSPVRDENSYIGFAKSNPDYKLVNSSNHTITQYSNNAWPGAGRSYLFSPVEIIAMPLPILLDEGGNSVNVNCFGASNGSVTLGNISGGDGNYTISWSGPNGFTASGSTINNLAAGVYLFTIGDGSGAEPVSGSRTVGQPAILDAAVSGGQACAGNYNGNITITNAVGGSGNYEYSLNNGNWQSAGIFNALGAGTYTVQMRDAVAINCMRSLGTATVTDFVLSAAVSALAACTGTNNGSISISNATGGSGNYEYRINNGNWQTSNLFNGLGAGSYTLQMRDIDFNTCIKILDNQTITEYFLNAAVSSTSACAGTNNGSVSISNATGGSGNYEFSLYNGNWQPAGLFSNLGAGTYTVKMRDASYASCIKNLGNQTVTEYILTATVSSASACAGTGNGSVSISNATGGSGNYEFSLNNGSWQTASIFNGLAAGTYSVQMRDISFNSCIKNLGNQIITTYFLNASVTSTPACALTNNGSFIISNTSGGSGNYEFSLNNGSWQTASIFNNLAAGTYSVQMRDITFSSCVKNLGTQTITVFSLNATTSATPACAGTNNGSISLSNTAGGSGNYQFSLNNGTWQTAGLFNGLAAGSYTIQMRDIAFGSCVKNLGTQTITVFSLNAAVSSTSACPGTNSGTIRINDATGGSGNYNYQVNNGNWQTGAIFTGLIAGTYTLNMRDANNIACIKNLGNIVIAQAVAPSVTISANNPAFCNAVTLTASSANAASYMWGNGASGSSISLNNNNADGPYSVTVTNTNGCTGSASFQYVKQNILNNYTLVGLKTITLGENNTVNGSVGLTAAGQTTKINKNSVINGFVKSPVITLMQPVTVTKGSIIGVAALTLPVMLFNTAVTSNLPNLVIPDDYNGPAITYNVNALTIGRRAQVTLTGNVFGKIIIKESADVIFTATDISINDIAAENGKALTGGIDYLSIGFSPNTAIRIKNTIALGEKNLVNGFGATFYMGDVNTDAEKITINGKNTTVNANTYMPRGTLLITQSGTDASFTCIMNGTHIDETITSAKYITWSAVDCNAAPAPLQFMQEQTGTLAEQILTAEPQTPEVETTVTAKPGIAVYPSPTTGKFNLQLNTSAARAEIIIINQLGLEMGRESQHNIVKGGGFNFDISKYPAGSYYIKVITEKGVYTKQIVKTN